MKENSLIPSSVGTEDLVFLRGEKFSNNRAFRAIRNLPGKSRLEILKDQCSNKRIIHVGAADHKELITEKIRGGIWLHKIVTNASKDCIGVDINEDAVGWVSAEHGINNMIAGNMFSSDLVDRLMKSGPWDMMVLGEILEHIPNPVEFLSNIRRNYSDSVSAIVITVPNALRLANFLNAFRNFEAINTDHKYWFTPYTLASVCVAAGLTPLWIFPCHYVWELPRRHLIRRFLQRRFPLFRDCLVLCAKF